MDFVIIANAWGAARDNPTRKHQIARELARQGHRVLWLEGAGMRRPSFGSKADRWRILRKVVAALRPARRQHIQLAETGRLSADHGDRGRNLISRVGERKDNADVGSQLSGFPPLADLPSEDIPHPHALIQVSGLKSQVSPKPQVFRHRRIRLRRTSLRSHPSSDSGGIWVVSPLLIPLPAKAWIRWLNARIYFVVARFWCQVLGFKGAVLINYVPVLAEVERMWGRRGKRGQRSEVRGQKTEDRMRDAVLEYPLSGSEFHSSLKSQVSGLRSQPSAFIPHPCFVVYHCVDRWDRFDMYDSALMEEMDKRCCRYADLVIASSRDLYERCRAKNSNTALVDHGVNYSHFAEAMEIREREEGRRHRMDDTGQMSREKAREDTKRGDQGSGSRIASMNTDGPGEEVSVNGLRGPASSAGRSPCPSVRPVDLPEGKIVGFFGLLSEWVDQDLLRQLARALPRASIVLIGKADVSIEGLKAESNIVLLGARSFGDLPSYTAFFDVGIIPFVVNELTNAVNPIKLREMLAAGCPVVSVGTAEAMEYLRRSAPRGLSVASSREEFVDKVRQVLAQSPSMEERKNISVGVASETWEAKVAQILELIREGGCLQGEET